jgi:hypothetical protein
MLDFAAIDAACYALSLYEADEEEKDIFLQASFFSVFSVKKMS